MPVQTHPHSSPAASDFLESAQKKNNVKHQADLSTLMNIRLQLLKSASLQWTSKLFVETSLSSSQQILRGINKNYIRKFKMTVTSRCRHQKPQQWNKKGFEVQEWCWILLFVSACACVFMLTHVCAWACGLHIASLWKPCGDCRTHVTHSVPQAINACMHHILSNEVHNQFICMRESHLKGNSIIFICDSVFCPCFCQHALKNTFGKGCF